MVDPRIFESLQTKIDEDAEARDLIRAILQTLERQDRTTQSILSRAHSTPAAHRMPLSYLKGNPLTQYSCTCHLFRWEGHRRWDCKRQKLGWSSLEVTILQVRSQPRSKDWLTIQVQRPVDSRRSKCDLCHPIFGLARRYGHIQHYSWGRQASYDWGGWNGSQWYVKLCFYRARTDNTQFLSISRTEMPSISPSKNTSSHWSRWSKSLHVLL